MPRTTPQGFTLAELLIALALLGIIAAFTIPKVLQSSGQNEQIAKVREAVSTLENTWYNLKNQNQVLAGTTLYAQIIGSINSIDQNPGDVDVGNGPYAGMAPAHPCGQDASMDTGWIQFPNGLVISGLADGPVMTSSSGSAVAVDNYVICIDYNGRGSPNVPGTDIFLGNFNQWGDFNAAPPPSPTANGKNFNWGNPNDAVRRANGSPLPGPIFNLQSAQVGVLITP